MKTITLTTRVSSIRPGINETYCNYQFHLAREFAHALLLPIIIIIVFVWSLMFVFVFSAFAQCMRIYLIGRMKENCKDCRVKGELAKPTNYYPRHK